MKCIHCGNDANYKDRQDRKCPSCHTKFAFEPKAGDKITDMAFQSAIQRVSGDGKLRWSREFLYYEIARYFLRKKRANLAWVLLIIPLLFLCAFLALVRAPASIAFAIPTALLTGWFVRRRWLRPVFLDFPRQEFDSMFSNWVSAHGSPKGLIVRKERADKPALESDIEHYSFDRAVICDRESTVDVLIANNFHFENNCAILSIDGYPSGPFETVRTMLKRNPRLQVFALHDATPAGCTIAVTLANDPQWFKDQVVVIDVGLRPNLTRPFRGLFLRSHTPVAPSKIISASEANWLSQFALELAAIRPEQILRRLFKAINRANSSSKDDDEREIDIDLDFDSGDDGGNPASGSTHIVVDQDSFAADAADSDGGADSFG
ncbi:MAG: hypothetical protein U1F16_02650 [Turneriella sp.]